MIIVIFFKMKSEYLTSQDLKEVGTNYLRYVIKNTDNDNFKEIEDKIFKLTVKLIKEEL